MASIKSKTVEVKGLRELSKALGELSKEAKKELSKASKEVAEVVAKAARAKAGDLGGVAAKTAPSITARGSLKSAGVSFGGARYPFGGGAEFGAYAYPQFKPWSGNDSGAGYFVYPTIRDESDTIHDEYVDRINDLIQRNFPH